MGFYIIEINDKYKQVVLLSAEGELYCKDVAGLMPYTEPDLDTIRNEAYEKGVQDTKQHWVDAPRTCAYKLGYENGLNDAWECARKIGSNSMCSLKEMGFDFGQCVINDYNPCWFVVKNYSVSECIEKIRQYEQEQDRQARIEYNFDEIKDVLETTAKECNVSIDEIAEVLEKMREES